MQPRRPGFWKFNSSLLEDLEYVDKLLENLPLFTSKYSDVQDLSLEWDLIKMEIRGFSIKFSKIKAKIRKHEELILQNDANVLLKQIEKNPNDKRLLNKFHATNLRLQVLLRQKTKGAILRSKTRWHEQGERNTRYFLELEKR